MSNVGVPQLAREKLQEFRYRLDGLESVFGTRDVHRFHKVGQLFRAEPQNARTYNSAGRVSALVEHGVEGCGFLKNFRTMVMLFAWERDVHASGQIRRYVLHNS